MSHSRYDGSIHARRGRQNGTVLVVAMVLLVVLTLLGVSAMNTTSLQERMAGNTQELGRAFQTAESGLSAAFADPDSFNLTTVVNAKLWGMFAGLPAASPYASGANFSSQFVGSSAPPVGSLYSATTFSAFHFETRATAFSEATDGANVTGAANAAAITLVGGAYQIGPKL
ncbi:MAG: PilX N-terminal domain-containing pilus assembly protein [Gammaproteobacteria bacterium]